MNRIATTLALAAGISCAAFGYEPPRHNDTFTTNGITYAQRGGLGASDYVVTNIDANAVGKVKSVNGKTGTVVLAASDIGALGNTGEQAIVGESSDHPYFKIGFDATWPWLEFGEFNGAKRAYSPHTTGVLAVLTDIPPAVSNVVTKAYVENLGITLSETDPTVPAWAKASAKPTYTASEVGAYSTNAIDTILQDYLPLDYFQDGQTIPMYWGDGTKLCDFGANWLGNLVNTVDGKPDEVDIPPAVSNVVTTAYVREKLGVYLYVGEDGGIYVHTNEE